MSTRMRDAMAQRFKELRHEPTEKRVRVALGGETIVDTTDAVLVWEPRRIVPTYAVPVADLRASTTAGDEVMPGGPGFLHPGIPFSVHSTAGQPLSISGGGQSRPDAGFRPADPELSDYVVLDFDAFDWFEEDERIHAHPRDPYHRVDARASSRRIRIEDGGTLLAETSRAVLVFETNLPVRFYLPREDVVAALTASDQVSYCPYKGEASYWSTDSRSNVVWSYQAPLPDAMPIAGLVAFYDDLLDVTVDGKLRDRPGGAVVRSLRDEFGVS
ncbi:hypothetical protein Ais01nite_44710 [Asanoa ishikariensis]|uniref:Uncharacterized conserved protein, DUF427 family n=1 Tax=Asanoa ishikariensis TaxID=137265 RepID=A0A1H3S666_9ACTN|nr:DUF427 domain-containing protein [Asanoa ishikariensis]GIF66436.1 hypothetical protein Ais01nite_44710 [Asanoa ishikariensis]SDZ33452.1 Uncharacterized conserved protein, DUF427 family [Asanoa ishikariensis]